MTMTAPRSIFCACVLAVAGCASAPATHPDPGAAGCDAILGAFDEAVAAAGVRDAGATPIDGFPQLRVDRFLASFASANLDGSPMQEWVERAASLGRQGRAVELANLPAKARLSLERSLPGAGAETLESIASRCAGELTRRDLASPPRLALLRERAGVPDDYDTWKRIAGLYWLTRIAFAKGVRHWHDEVRETFAAPLASPAAGAARTAYVPPPGRLAPAAVRAILEASASPALRVPDPQGEAAEALYRTFAPAFVVGRASAADDPGEPGWVNGLPGVPGSAPVVFRRMSHARLGDQPLLQLEFWIWFPERPKASRWDLLGGRLDAVLWRVTLAPDGEPWVYDTIHACGCYHLFFPTARARARPLPETLDETAFVPQALPRVPAGTPIEVWIEATTHYVQRVVVGESGVRAVPYAFREDDALRSLPRADGSRASLFGPDGIATGTERGERWLFWPMGIREPGAMRQWGRHPTAFVGRRHFDDPGLIPQYFELH